MEIGYIVIIGKFHFLAITVFGNGLDSLHSNERYSAVNKWDPFIVFSSCLALSPLKGWSVYRQGVSLPNTLNP